MSRLEYPVRGLSVIGFTFLFSQFPAQSHETTSDSVPAVTFSAHPAPKIDPTAAKIWSNGLTAIQTLPRGSLDVTTFGESGLPLSQDQVNWQRTPGKPVQLENLSTNASNLKKRWLLDGSRFYLFNIDEKSVAKLNAVAPGASLRAFEANPSLYFGVAPLVINQDWLKDPRLVSMQMENSRPYHRDDAGHWINVDSIRIASMMPGEAKPVEFVYSFQKNTHLLERLWLERDIEGSRMSEVSYLTWYTTVPKAAMEKHLTWAANTSGYKEISAPPPLTLFEKPAIARAIAKIDPTAVDLLQKAVEPFRKAKTWKITAKSTISEHRVPMWAEITFSGPENLRVDEVGVTGHWLFVSDGINANSFSPIEKSTTSGRVGDVFQRLSVKRGISTTLFPLGHYLAQWYRGRTYVHPLVLPDMLVNALKFEVSLVPAQIVRGSSVEGVRTSAGYEASLGTEPFFWEQTCWIRPTDGRLMRIDFSSKEGKKVVRGRVEVIGEKFDLPISPDTFVYKEPKH